MNIVKIRNCPAFIVSRTFPRSPGLSAGGFALLSHAQILIQIHGDHKQQHVNVDTWWYGIRLFLSRQSTQGYSRFFSILFNSRIFCKQVFLNISSFVEFLCVFGSIAFSPTGHKEGGLIIVHLAFGLGGGRHAWIWQAGEGEEEVYCTNRNQIKKKNYSLFLPTTFCKVLKSFFKIRRSQFWMLLSSLCRTVLHLQCVLQHSRYRRRKLLN